MSRIEEIVVRCSACHSAWQPGVQGRHTCKDADIAAHEKAGGAVGGVAQLPQQVALGQHGKLAGPGGCVLAHLLALG